MQNPKQKTFMLKQHEIKNEWFVIDADGKTLGRLSSEIAKILRGKHRPTFTPHVDSGAGVIVLNAAKVNVTGSKEARKVYRRYTGYPGGQRESTYRDLMQRKPEFIIEHAVKGMIPRTVIGRNQLRRLRIYAGATHDLEAQKPIVVNC